MNDRFKFKVWDKENKKFLHDLSFDISYNGTLILSCGIEGKKYINPNDNNRYILIQCTGLKDKNGKLIYEGDIIEVRYIGNQISLFKNEYSEQPETERFEVFCHPEWLKFYAKNDNYRKSCEIHSLDLERILINDYNKTYEVIGNIYENKSLLESEG